MSTDCAFGMPADRQARENSHGSNNTYWYVFGMRPKNTGTVFPEWMGEAPLFITIRLKIIKQAI